MPDGFHNQTEVNIRDGPRPNTLRLFGQPLASFRCLLEEFGPCFQLGLFLGLSTLKSLFPSHLCSCPEVAVTSLMHVQAFGGMSPAAPSLRNGRTQGLGNLTGELGQHFCPQTWVTVWWVAEHPPRKFFAYLMHAEELHA